MTRRPDEELTPAELELRRKRDRAIREGKAPKRRPRTEDTGLSPGRIRAMKEWLIRTHSTTKNPDLAHSIESFAGGDFGFEGRSDKDIAQAFSNFDRIHHGDKGTEVSMRQAAEDVLEGMSMTQEEMHASRREEDRQKLLERNREIDAFERRVKEYEENEDLPGIRRLRSLGHLGRRR
jgi:hypothetical protein